jgi:hypothetical protein
MLLNYILVLLVLVSLGLSISSFFIKKSKMKNLLTESSADDSTDMNDFYKTFIFTNYKDFLNNNLGISNINDLEVHFCGAGDKYGMESPCRRYFTKWCNSLIIYNTKTLNLFYCFEDKNSIVYNYYIAQQKYNEAKTKLAKDIPAAKDIFRKQDREK